MTRPLTAGRRGRGVCCWTAGFGGRFVWGVAKQRIVKLMSPLAMVIVAATVLCSVLGLVLAQQADDYLEQRPSAGVTRGGRCAAGGLARI